MTLTDTPVAAPDTAARRTSIGLAIVLVAQLMLVLDTTVVNVALPRIQTDLDFSSASLSWVLNAYTLAFGGLLLLGGRIGDVLGRRRVFRLGLAVFTLSSLAGALATEPALLVGARTLQGVGAALAAPGVLALITTSTPDQSARNRALALFTAVSSTGASVGLLLGGVLTDLGSWRWTLLINVPIGIVVLTLVGRFVDETPRRPGRFDVVGALTVTGAAVSAVYALITAPDHGWGSTTTLGLLALAVVLAAAFLVTEGRVAHPLLRLGLLRSRQRLAVLTIMALMVGAQFSMFFLAILYVQRVLGFGPFESGLAFLPLSLAIFAASRLSPQLIRRVGPWPMIAVGTAGMAVTFLWISGLDAGSSYASAMFLPMLLNGFFAGLSFMPVTVIALSDVEPEHAGAASGLLQTMQQLGGAVGLAVIVSVYTSHSVAGEVVPGLREGFSTSAVFDSIGVLLALTGVLAGVRAARSARAAEPLESSAA